VFPFTLSGPPFLVLYSVSALLLLIGYWLYRQSRGGGREQARISELTDDPYKIAYLRGGDFEMVRLAIVNLVDRGLLGRGSISGTLKTRDKVSAKTLRRPLDRALLAAFAADSLPGTALMFSQVRAACEQYRQELVSQGLILDDAQKRQVLMGLVVVLAVIGGVAIIRILQAFSRGQSNIFLLVIAATLACWVAYRLGAGDFTSTGRRALGSLQTLMMRLKARAGGLANGGATNEALLLAAVFGIYALPATAFPFVEQMYPRPWWSRSGSDGRGSSSCGSGCGGGGGGGGGCGGGGGGCGGCGGG
jgi:uncharacterized protein (TIGR04222 family)